MVRSGDGTPLQAHVAPWRANLAGYNRKVKDAEKAGTPIEDPLWIPDPVLELTGEEQSAPALTTLPSIVVVIDEFAT